MSFEPALAKLTIASVDNKGLQVAAQYNPKELQIDKTIPWQKPSQANQTNAKGLALEFTGAESRTMTVELLFDGYERKGATPNGSVTSLITSLETLASPVEPDNKDENKRRPHLCVVSWGAGGMPTFRCVIESISTKYTMFSTEGVPLRATCTVKLKEADVVSMAKAK